jgi:cellobiose phosphorylase
MASKAKYDKLLARVRANLKARKSVTAGLSQKDVQALRTRYSTFEDSFEAGMLASSEVVVKALRPPRPYVHLMASNHYRLRGAWGSFWDNTGGGFSCLDSVLAGKMTSHLDTNYVPTAPEVQDVRRFFIHEAGSAWPMFPTPGYEEKLYAGYQCRQGMDAFTLSARRAGLAAKLQVHVPVDWPLEVWQVSLTNTARKARRLKWFLHLRVCVDSYPFYYFCPRVVCEGRLEDGAMVFLNHDQNNKHPRQAFMVADPPFDGYDMMNEAFDGWSPRAVIPAAVAKGRCTDSPGLQPAAGLVAAAQFDARLAPGQTKTWTVIYGACELDDAKRKEWIAHVRREVLAKPAQSRQAVADCWREKVLANAIDTPDGEINRFFNVWSKYQARNQGRYVRALDRLGYRDVLQDMLGLADFEAPFVRARLAECLQAQFADGRAPRQYELLPGSGHDLRMYQDAPVWIPDTLIKYVKETGDFEFLNQPLAYLDAKTNQPSATEVGTVYDHAVRGLRSVYGNTGFHGLCKIGYGDWNDSLSRIGGEKGVSVWLSCACVYAAKLMAELAEHLGKTQDAAAFSQVAADLTGRINEHAWDGQWYIYAINGEGKPIGSSTNPQGKLHLNVNTWAILAGVAQAAGREEQVWKAIKKLATPCGHVLLDPPYTRASRNDVGRIADMMPGQFENGSIYTHGESFYLYSLVRAGRSDQWLAELPNTLSSYLAPDISTGPPHQLSNYAVGPAHPAFGQNLFSNFTGSVAWYRRGIETVCGVLADFAGLSIEPRPPKAWKAYRVTKNFRLCRVNLSFKRGKKFSVRLHGEELPGRLIPAALLPAETAVNVEVTYV